MPHSTVDFVTFCHWRDVDRLHEPGVLAQVINSHQYKFNRLHLVYQRIPVVTNHPVGVNLIESDDYPHILEDYGIEPRQPKADEMTHGPDAPHYWKWHVINHLIGHKESEADYIVFSDCDCYIKNQPTHTTWIDYGITLLQRHDSVFMVSPSDGGGMAESHIHPDIRLTQNVSQQLFLVDRKRFGDADFDIPWDWEYLAPGEPMQEYYYMLEGRIWRYIYKHNLWRAILPQKWRYWHRQW